MSHVPGPECLTRVSQVGAVPGTQPKVCALFIDGIAVESIPGQMTPINQEVLEGVVLQLDWYCRRQLDKSPTMDVQRLQAHVRRELLGRCKALSITELDWVMGTLVERMGWQSPNAATLLNADGVTISPCGATIFKLTQEEAARLIALENRSFPIVKSVVDVALETLAMRLGEPGCR